LEGWGWRVGVGGLGLDLGSVRIREEKGNS
jgi:hypothetical protein